MCIILCVSTIPPGISTRRECNADLKLKLGGPEDKALNRVCIQ